MFRSAFLIEDNSAVVTALRIGFRGAGVELEAVGSVGDARAALEKVEPEVLLVDLILPDGDGREIVKEQRAARPDLPIVILTGLGGESDVVEGLEVGADLYLKKPFSATEVLAHLAALYRRIARSDSTIEFGGVEADLLSRRATRGGEEARLTDVETRLLATLLEARGELVSRDELLLKVWNLTFDPGTGLLHSHIRNLRRKLRPLGVDGWIEASRGRGYRFIDGDR